MKNLFFIIAILVSFSTFAEEKNKDSNPKAIPATNEQIALYEANRAEIKKLISSIDKNIEEADNHKGAIDKMLDETKKWKKY